MSQQKIFNTIGRQNNINAVRYYLALCILINHFGILSGSEVFQLPRIFGGAGSFFAISGFLLFNSFEKRPNASQYFRRRAARIFPPYFFVVILAALSLWPLSKFSVTQYFESKGLWTYLMANLSFLNFLEPSLPGVFTPETNFSQAVNGSLWTMKGEVACYITVPIVYWLIKRFNRAGVVLNGCIILFSALFLLFQLLYFSHGGHWEILRRQAMVMLLFYIGAVLNLKLNVLTKHSRWIIAICGIYLISDWLNKQYLGFDMPTVATFVNALLVPLASGLMVIACSVTGRWGSFLWNHDPFTYEIYLFHFPIIQTLVATGVVATVGAYPALFLALILTSALAWGSYHFVSAPFIKR